MAWPRKFTHCRGNKSTTRVKKNILNPRFRLVIYIFLYFLSILTWDSVDGFEGTEDPHGPNGRQVDVLQVQGVLHHPEGGGTQTRDTER